MFSSLRLIRSRCINTTAHEGQSFVQQRDAALSQAAPQQSGQEMDQSRTQNNSRNPER